VDLDLKELGRFEISKGEVVVSDPCYPKGIWCQGILSGVKTGLWKAVARTCDSGERVGELIAFHEAHGSLMDLRFQWKKEYFSVGVDSGQAGFFQEDKYRNDACVGDTPIPEWLDTRKEGDKWYGSCCTITIDAMAGVLDGGVVASSGYGDGIYDVYTAEENGEIVAMKLVFIEEDEEWDDEEWEEEEENGEEEF